jgi:hypothetical protein
MPPVVDQVPGGDMKVSTVWNVSPVRNSEPTRARIRQNRRAAPVANWKTRHDEYASSASRGS